MIYTLTQQGLRQSNCFITYLQSIICDRLRMRDLYLAKVDITYLNRNIFQARHVMRCKQGLSA
jgi:hypothetical protein